MNRNPQSVPERELLAEINEQVRSLQELSKFYCSAAGMELLESLPIEGRFLFVGSSPELPASQLAAQLFCSLGVDASAISANALTQWPSSLLDRYNRVFLFSSTEVEKIKKRAKSEQWVSLINDPENKQIDRVGTLLPTFAGTGSSPFLNYVALSWLISRRLTGQWQGSEAEQLKRLRQRIQLLLEGRSALLEQWQHCLAGHDHLILSGQGIQAQIAARASLYLLDWAGIGTTVVPWQALTHPLTAGWAEIQCCDSAESKETETPEPEHSAQIVWLIDGYPQVADDPARPTVGLPAGLGGLLNWVSLQLLASDVNF